MTLPCPGGRLVPAVVGLWGARRVRVDAVLGNHQCHAAMGRGRCRQKRQHQDGEGNKSKPAGHQSFVFPSLRIPVEDRHRSRRVVKIVLTVDAQPGSTGVPADARRNDRTLRKPSQLCYHHARG